jgi:Flp pilus assembly pilin Flp
MKNILSNDHRNQRGVAAVEFAVILPLLVLLMALTLFFGRLFWHYTVAQKAAHDAVMMLAIATKVEIGTKTPDFTIVEIAKLAKAVAEEEIAELNPGYGRPYVDVTCDDLACLGEVVPSKVRVAVRMNITDIFFDGLMDDFGGGEGITLHADVRMPYVGN